VGAAATAGGPAAPEAGNRGVPPVRHHIGGERDAGEEGIRAGPSHCATTWTERGRGRGSGGGSGGGAGARRRLGPPAAPPPLARQREGERETGRGVLTADAAWQRRLAGGGHGGSWSALAPVWPESGGERKTLEQNGATKCRSNPVQVT
jgi:hypothetical protein